jgi:serine/threonine-protein phosphatase 2A regulatory subunit A
VLTNGVYADAQVDSASAMAELLPLFLTLSQDRQDSVRIHTVDNAVALARVIAADVTATQVLPVVFETARDGSWRVRWSVANRFPEIGETIGAEIVNASLCDSIVALLEDNEAEVRTAATSKVCICWLFGITQKSKLTWYRSAVPRFLAL